MRLRPAIKWLKGYWLYIVICIFIIVYTHNSIIEPFEEPFAKIDKFIERSNKDAPREINGVPLVVYRSWITDKIPRGMLDAVNKTIEMTPEFDNYFYSDAECLKFIEDNFEPNVANAFRSFKPGAYQSDLWRYCILYKKGGVYINIPAVLQMPLFDILKEYPKLFIVDNPATNPCKDSAGVWNGFMASPPGNPVFRDCIDEIVETCKNRDYKQHPIDVTVCTLARMLDKREGHDFLKSLPFVHAVLPSKEFHYKGKVFFTQYDGYRKDQGNTQKTAHYSELWNKRDIFNLDVIFE
jgi:hypothetical protein